MLSHVWSKFFMAKTIVNWDSQIHVPYTHATGKQEKVRTNISQKVISFGKVVTYKHNTGLASFCKSGDFL